MIAEKEPKRILIASGSDKGCEYLCRFFPEPEFYPVVLTNNAAEARRRLAEEDFDIVLVNSPLRDEFGTEFAVETVDIRYTGVIVLVKNELYDQIAYKLEECGGVCEDGKEARCRHSCGGDTASLYAHG